MDCQPKFPTSSVTKPHAQEVWVYWQSFVLETKINKAGFVAEEIRFPLWALFLIILDRHTNYIRLVRITSLNSTSSAVRRTAWPVAYIMRFSQRENMVLIDRIRFSSRGLVNSEKRSVTNSRAKHTPWFAVRTKQIFSELDILDWLRGSV